MHLHILGICGTFMGGIAAIARAAGHTVTGCDANVYPPMSDQLRVLGIELTEGWDRSEEHTSELQSPKDLVCRLLLEKKNNNTHDTSEISDSPSPPSRPTARVAD